MRDSTDGTQNTGSDFKLSELTGTFLKYAAWRGAVESRFEGILGNE